MSDLNNRRFTDCARLILDQLPHRACARGLFRADSASVNALALWTLIRWERKLGLVALEQMRVDLHSLADELDARLRGVAADGHADIVKGNPPVFASTGKPIFLDWLTKEWPADIEVLINQAEFEARQLGHDYVGTEHLLLAVIRLADAELAKILDKHGIAYERTRQTILTILGQGHS